MGGFRLSGSSDDFEFSSRISAAGKKPRAGHDANAEDVLDRIRRMVREEAALKRPSVETSLRDRLAAPDPEPQRPELQDPLVLTPDHKVAPESRRDRKEIVAPTGGASNLFAGSQTMDDTEMRELVAKVVREELEGAFGEQLTRNIRKMIRREIAQAMRVSE